MDGWFLFFRFTQMRCVRKGKMKKKRKIEME